MTVPSSHRLQRFSLVSPRLCCPVHAACGTVMMTNLVTELDPSLLDLLAAVLERHAGDPLVQLAYAQMWEVLLDRSVVRPRCSWRGTVAALMQACRVVRRGRHLPLIRTVVLTQKVKEVVVTSLSAMKRHLRIHLLQWKHLCTSDDAYVPDTSPRTGDLAVADLACDCRSSLQRT